MNLQKLSNCPTKLPSIDTSIVICPAHKGKSIIVKDRENYASKMQDQLDEGDYEFDGRKEKTLLDKLHKKLTIQLKIMDIDLMLVTDHIR